MFVANKVTVGIVTSFVAYMLIVIVEPTLAHRGSGYMYCTGVAVTTEAAVTPRVTTLSDDMVAMILGATV